MHNLKETDKQQGVKQAWHHLTEIVPDLSLDKNWLADWDVQPQKLYIGKHMKEIPFSQLTCTDDESILVGQPYNPLTYKPITNAQFIQLARESVAGTGHELVSAGSVRGRGRTFLSFKVDGLGKYYAGGRTFDPYLNYGNGHDKSSVLWVNTSNNATVCDNTYTINLFKAEQAERNGGVGVRQRHTINAEMKFPEIARLVDAAVGVQAEFAAAFESLAEQNITVEDAQRAYAGFVAGPDVDTLATRGRNIVEVMTALFLHGRGNHGQNLADLFSGVTDYYTHEISRNNAQRQFLSSEFGSGAARKNAFWSIVCDGEKLDETIIRGAKVLAGK